MISHYKFIIEKKTVRLMLYSTYLASKNALAEDQKVHNVETIIIKKVVKPGNFSYIVNIQYNCLHPLFKTEIASKKFNEGMLTGLRIVVIIAFIYSLCKSVNYGTILKFIFKFN